MKRFALPLALALPALLWAGCADQAPPLDPESAHPLTAAGGPHVVQVAPPTGELADDRASILAALEQVRPGGTVQFAAGTYVIGDPDPNSLAYIEVTVSRITLRGHPGGTTLRGCDPDEVEIVWGACFGLELSGGHQTVRELGFQDFSQALALGKDLYLGPADNRTGGYRVENNSFRNTTYALSSFGRWLEPAVVRNNGFVNVGIGIEVYGRTVHALDNDVFTPEPGQVPDIGEALAGIWFVANEEELSTGPCDHNIAARNRIEGYNYGVLVGVITPGAGCRHNVIRANTIVDSRGEAPAWPLGLYIFLGEGPLEHNVVEGNHIHGSEGQGIVVYFSGPNRIVNNTVTDITMTAAPPPGWGEADGVGVWIAGSHATQLLNNRFTDVEGNEVVLQGNYNHVATRSASDVVRDLGVGNRVTGPGSVVTTAAPAGARAAAAIERAGAARMLGERVGVRGLLLGREAAQVAPR
jgi:parallel beta-helix repeat protein